MLCPVCLADVLTDDGVVMTHCDSLGKICPMSGREPFVWNERSTRLAVPGRSFGFCEYCGALATNMHHRKARSQGGLWTPANILHLCGSGTTGCHGHFTNRGRATGYKLGVNLHRGEDPALVPVRTPIRLLWLSDDVAPPLPGWAR